MVDSLSCFSFQPVLHDWCNKGCGMCYPVCGMVHIKDSLLLIEKSSQCCGSSGNPFLFYPIELFLLCVGFPILLSGPLPYVQRHTNMGVIWWGTGWKCLPHVWLWGEQYLISPHQIFFNIQLSPPPPLFHANDAHAYNCKCIECVVKTISFIWFSYKQYH